MGLIISRNGKIQDYSSSSQKRRPQNTSQKHVAQTYQDQKKQSLKHSKILHAKDVASSPVITASPEERIEEAITLMEKYQIHHLPLVNEDHQVVGIISDRDILLARKSERISSVMKTDVLMAKELTDVKVVAKMMISNRISAVPLINEHNHLVGIVTKTDLLECLVRSLPHEQYV